MSRTVPEWVGKSDDEKIPDRVKIRVFEKAGGRCEICSRKLGPADKWQADHTVALINGGKNRETNLRVACDWCHKEKTASDLAEKSAIYTKKAKHLGVKKSKRPWHPGFRKKMSGEVVRVER